MTGAYAGILNGGSSVRPLPMREPIGATRPPEPERTTGNGQTGIGTVVDQVLRDIFGGGGGGGRAAPQTER
jgi:hypothetical protein